MDPAVHGGRVHLHRYRVRASRATRRRHESEAVDLRSARLTLWRLHDGGDRPIRVKPNTKRKG